MRQQPIFPFFEHVLLRKRTDKAYTRDREQGQGSYSTNCHVGEHCSQLLKLDEDHPNLKRNVNIVFKQNTTAAASEDEAGSVMTMTARAWF